jgi:hypothetical protein
VDRVIISNGENPKSKEAIESKKGSKDTDLSRDCRKSPGSRFSKKSKESLKATQTFRPSLKIRENLDPIDERPQPKKKSVPGSLKDLPKSTKSEYNSLINLKDFGLGMSSQTLTNTANASEANMRPNHKLVTIFFARYLDQST